MPQRHRAKAVPGILASPAPPLDAASQRYLALVGSTARRPFVILKLLLLVIPL